MELKGAVVNGGEIRKSGFEGLLHGLQRFLTIASCSVGCTQPDKYCGKLLRHSPDPVN